MTGSKPLRTLWTSSVSGSYFQVPNMVCVSVFVYLIVSGNRRYSESMWLIEGEATVEDGSDRQLLIQKDS